MQDNVSDLTLEVLKNIRAELKGLREESRIGLAALREEMHAGFESVNERLDLVNERIDGVLKIVGTHHTDHEARLRRIERHLKLRQR